VWNLLSNAVKLTPAGGRIEVGLERAESPGKGQGATFTIELPVRSISPELTARG
jgi:signal transduction histidine kinase